MFFIAVVSAQTTKPSNTPVQSGPISIPRMRLFPSELNAVNNRAAEPSVPSEFLQPPPSL